MPEPTSEVPFTQPEETPITTITTTESSKGFISRKTESLKKTLTDETGAIKSPGSVKNGLRSILYGGSAGWIVSEIGVAMITGTEHASPSRLVLNGLAAGILIGLQFSKK
jgi:hypothetical protein